MNSQFRQKLQKIDKERANLTADDSGLDAWVGDQLASIRADMLEFQRDNAYRRFLVRYLTEQYDHLQDPGHEREKPLCTCENNCTLMRGKLPATVLDAPTIADGIEEFAHEHNGHPTGLFEADRAYREAIGDLLTRLERVRTALINGEIPATADADREVSYAGT